MSVRSGDRRGTQFGEQGGAATMDPGRLRRWITSRVLTRIASPEYLARRRVAAERRRARGGAPHRVEYFHQPDDPYSQLAAQLLPALAARYGIELGCHLVTGPQGDNVAEPELLAGWSRRDAALIAPHYALQFPREAAAPDPELLALAMRVLAAQDAAQFVAVAADVGRALWQRDATALAALAQSHGAVSGADAAAAVAAGTARRRALGHYAGAMWYYGGEWYWGVDRLYHLEQRLAALGLDRAPGEPLLAPRPPIDTGPRRADGRFTLEIYPSLRSPYTAISFDRAVALARELGLRLVLRPVLPMVMRGVPATREKGFYIFTDAAREARAAGVPYGRFYDPIGEPVRRCYALYPWAAAQGRSAELLSSFLRTAFVDGVDTNSVRGLRRVVEAAGLDWGEAQAQLRDTRWHAMLEDNRRAMYALGLWGVPSFRLLDAQGEERLALWGQDRLWLLSREIQRLLAGP